MSEDDVKGMNFFTRIITSIKDFEKYSIFAVEKVGKAISYLALIIIIFSAIVSGVFTYKFSSSVDIALNYLKNDINEIDYKDGILSINLRRGN